ncbi:hypothetical protein ADU59_09110 [Pararhizobium polonicum]|uniref:Uncharacterized protein n=1 Tax=Pararhizobium polonicum TaxID=1612624 RepID=A0A1C7P2Q6_9HYPH|nr:hypothetical protein ADU59_09110 [Pararhizobium polonicum]
MCRRWTAASRGGQRGAALLCQRECCDQTSAAPHDDRHGCAVAARPSAGKREASVYLPFLIAEVEHRPDITMPELAGELDGAHGIRVAPSSLSRVLVAQGFPYKKP